MLTSCMCAAARCCWCTVHHTHSRLVHQAAAGCWCTNQRRGPLLVYHWHTSFIPSLDHFRTIALVHKCFSHCPSGAHCPGAVPNPGGAPPRICSESNQSSGQSCRPPCRPPGAMKFLANYLYLKKECFSLSRILAAVFDRNHHHVADHAAASQGKSLESDIAADSCNKGKGQVNKTKEQKPARGT